MGSIGVPPAALSAARVAAAPVGARTARVGHELRVHSRRVLAADGVLVAHRHAAGHSAQVRLSPLLHLLLRQPFHVDPRARHGARLRRCVHFSHAIFLYYFYCIQYGFL